MKKFSLKTRKSQAAMEFLMTYGWAILVVLVAIGALAYFGVLSPDRFLPSKCTLPAGVACVDFNVDTDTVNVVLRNGLGFDLDDVYISISGCGTSTTTGATLLNGAQGTFTAGSVTACGFTAGTKFNGDINVSYLNRDTTLSHYIQGSLTGRIG